MPWAGRNHRRSARLPRLHPGDRWTTGGPSLGGQFLEDLGGGRVALAGEALEGGEVAVLGCGLDQLVGGVGVPAIGLRSQDGHLEVSHERPPFADFRCALVSVTVRMRRGLANRP